MVLHMLVPVAGSLFRTVLWKLMALELDFAP